MIKKTFIVMAIAAIAAVAGWGYQQSDSEVTLSDLASENLEALADKRPKAARMQSGTVKSIRKRSPGR